MIEKRVSFRKEIKQADPFETFWIRVISVASRHRREMGIGIAGLLVLVLLITAGVAYARHREGKAAALFSEAQDLVYADSPRRIMPGMKKPPAPDPVAQQEAVASLVSLVENYGGTHGGQLARLLLGQIYYDRGDFGASAGMYRDFLAGKVDPDELGAMAWEGLAYAQEAGADYAGALESYRAMSQVEQPFMRGWAQSGMARCYEMLGRPEEAAKAYGRLLAENPHHSKAEEARARIARYAKHPLYQSSADTGSSHEPPPDRAAGAKGDGE